MFTRQVRFSNYRDEWIRYRASDLLDFFSTNSLSWEHLEYSRDGVYNLHYGVIHQELSNHMDVNTSDLPCVKKEHMPKNYTLCQNGDIAFADASEDTNDVAKVIEFLNCDQKDIVCGLHTIHARDKINVTVEGFKGYAFASKLFRKQIRRLAQGTKVYSITPKTIMECYVDIPSKQEQVKIYKILSSIRNKLATERKFLVQLENQKQYLLQNLFI